MNWQIALVLWYATSVGQSLWQRVYSQKSELPETFPPALSYLLAVTPLGVIVGLSIGHHVHWSAWVLTLLAIEGAFIGLFNWLMFVAIKRLPVATFQLIFQSYAVVTIVLGWVLLHETLSAPQVVGAVLLLAAAVVATQTPVTKGSAQPKSHRTKAIILATLAAVALGIGLVTEKAALKYMDIGAYFIFGFATQTLALTLLAVKDFRPSVIKQIRAHDLKRSFIMGTLSALVGFFYIYAIRHSNNISLITALGAFSLPLVVLASYVILKERENTKRLAIASALGCIGIIITAL